VRVLKHPVHDPPLQHPGSPGVTGVVASARHEWNGRCSSVQTQCLNKMYGHMLVLRMRATPGPLAAATRQDTLPQTGRYWFLQEPPPTHLK
jgi:hypothetical protein